MWSSSLILMPFALERSGTYANASGAEGSGGSGGFGRALPSRHTTRSKSSPSNTDVSFERTNCTKGQLIALRKKGLRQAYSHELDLLATDDAEPSPELAPSCRPSQSVELDIQFGEEVMPRKRLPTYVA